MKRNIASFMFFAVIIISAQSLNARSTVSILTVLLSPGASSIFYLNGAIHVIFNGNYYFISMHKIDNSKKEYLNMEMKAINK
jgi:hypothetical protein